MIDDSLNVVDSSGWIEYFLGTSQAGFFAPALEDTDNLIVPAIAIYEVHKRITQLISENSAAQCIQVMRRGRLISIDDKRAIAASTVSITHKLGFADAVMYSIALECRAQFWTQDSDYLGLANVRFCGKLK